MLSVSKHVVENDVILYEDEWVSRKAAKELELLRRHRTTQRMNSTNNKLKFKLQLHNHFI